MFNTILRVFQTNELAMIPIFIIFLYISIYTSQTKRLILILILLIFFIRVQLVGIY